MDGRAVAGPVGTFSYVGQCLVRLIDRLAAHHAPRVRVCRPVWCGLALIGGTIAAELWGGTPLLANAVVVLVRMMR